MKSKRRGFIKNERIITAPQNADIQVAGGRRVINLCANNYLGLADIRGHRSGQGSAREPWLRSGARSFIAGRRTSTRNWKKTDEILGTEDTILYSSCFDANGGLFETLLGAEDAVISDELNHASIIDGVRLCKAQRYRYKNSDMADLETKLKAAKGARFRMIATDGVFSMDGTIANLKGICDLAENMMRWSWWTTRTPPVLWARPGAAHPNIAASRDASMSSRER